MRPSEDIERIMGLYADVVWRAAALYFREPQDIQDAFQETFLRYALADDVGFEGDEHRKAWLIRVTRNLCLDMLRASSRKAMPLDEAALAQQATSIDVEAQPGALRSEVLDALRSLDDPPRTPLYLSVVEEYPATVIAEMLEAPVNTVYSWIARGKQKLREALA